MEITAVFIFELCRQTWYSLYMHLRGTVKMVPSRFVRKIVCRPQQNEVSQQWRKTLFCGSRTGGFCDVDYGTNAGFLKGKTQLSGKGNIGIVKCPIRGVRMYGNKSSKHKADNSDCVDSQRAELRCGRVFPTLCLSAAISDTVYIRRSCDTLCYGS